MVPEVPFTVETLLKAPLKHKFKALLAFIIPVALAVCAAYLLPKTYRSDAMIFVRLGRESVSLDPTATTGSMIPVFESRENEVNSVRDMLYSGGLAEKVVDRIGPEVVLGDAPLIEVQDTFPEPPVEDIKGSPRQKAIKLLNEKLYVISSRKSSVLVTTCEAASPHLAQKILEVYLDAYKNMHSVAHQTSKSNEFFGQQSDLLQIQWQKALEKLRVAKAEAGVVSISGMKENLKTQTNAIQSRLMNVESELLATKAKRDALEEIANKPMNARGIRADLAEAKSLLASLKGELSALKKQEQSLIKRAAKLNSDEVVIRQLEQEVKVAETNFAQYQELHEQTRIEEALLSSKLTNVRVVQEPSFVPKPVGPKKKIIAAAGIFVGLAGAVLISLLFELFFSKPSNQIRTSRQATDRESASSALDSQVASQGSLI